MRPILASLLRGPFSLEGLALFGSSARGEATEGSDVDLLIVLASSGAIDRSLYDWWHAHTEALHKKGTPSLSPHFVALPAKPSTVGSLWYEVAREGVICWDRNFRVTSVLRELREAMERGEVIRKVTYGHPYWVKIQEPIK
ncbi:MAG: nucleotidyltransferase domain-containing protein [Deltaproteobacteria bacterium]|nr:nucleotidyltransferase domain-containing protein [Deltaproteobacteria bacterium]MBI3296329.1 nucleotidyltransferase domain-containing protein [Deltaproteobacteria bacterium]